MSRIGNAVISLPTGVEVKQDGSLLTVKGKRGELTQVIDRDMKINVEDGKLTVERPTNQIRHKALHGLTRALVANMVEGVSNGYKKELELVGVGFRAQATGQVLEIAVGYSHPIVFLLPEEVKVQAAMEKGKAPLVTLESNDKQLLGQIAARIKSVRKIEPYKGKGIRFKGEYIRRKEGKSAKK